jgi:hypothetical protein
LGESFQLSCRQILFAKLDQVNTGSGGLFDTAEKSDSLIALGAGKLRTVGNVVQKHQTATVSCNE